MSGAARDLGRRVAATANEPVSVTVRNLSVLGSADAAEIERIFESELKIAAQSAVDVRLTISQNLTQFLLVAEMQRSSERQVLMECWPRSPAVPPAANANSPRVTLEKKLLWEQALPILDVEPAGDRMLLLDAAGVALLSGAEGPSAAIPQTHPWPRDMRGRLLVSGTAFNAYLPATICRGSTQPKLSMDCQDSQDPWFLAPGALAVFDSGRNLFTGRVDIEPGGVRELPPFFSAASTGGAWIFAAADGRAHVYLDSLEPAGTIEQWGSDIAALQTPCGPRILVTRASGFHEPDSIQAYELVNHAANPAGPPLEFSGPITALWAFGNFAMAVSRDPETERYAAFSLAATCGS